MKKATFGGVVAFLMLLGAMSLLIPATPASAQSARRERAKITYHRTLPVRSLVPGRTPQIVVENFTTAQDGTFTLTTSQPAIMPTTGTPTDVSEDVTVTAILDGTVIGTNTVGPFLDTTASTPLTLSIVGAPVAAGIHRLSVTYSATPTAGDTGVCTPYPQGCSPIRLSRGTFRLTAPSRT